MVTTRRRIFVAARRDWDRGLIALIALFIALLPLFYPRLYATDSVQYYAYLRSVVFDGDLDFRNEYQRFHELNPKSGIDKALLPRIDPGNGKLLNINPTTGKLVNVAPVGTAILWAPAFALAHIGVVLARGLGSPVAADGYSAPYIWAVCWASALYGLLGLVLSYRIARLFVGAWPAAAATIACWLASPLVFYMYVSPAWSHTASLFATALFVWHWLRTRPARSLRQWAVLGALGGLMVLTREQLGLFLLLPALDALRGYLTLIGARDLGAIRQRFIQHSLFLIVFVISLTPQLAAYQILNGRLGPSTVVLEKLGYVPDDPYAHGVVGSAHFWDTLIDPRPSPATGNWFAHGAFVWSPIWLLAIVGLALLWRGQRWLTALLFVAFAAQVWVNGRFGTTWHLSGAFGFRRLIEATPFFVLGAALLLTRVRLPRAAWSLVIVLLIAWNVGLIFQWTVLGARQPELRAGLVWSGMLSRQLEALDALTSSTSQWLSNRCALIQNGTCR